MFRLTNFLLVLLISLFVINDYATGKGKPGENSPFCTYSKSITNEVLPLTRIGNKLDFMYRSFPNSEWNSFCRSEYGKQVKVLSLKKINEVKLKSLRYIGGELVLPEELKELNSDFPKFIWLTNLRIEMPSKKITKEYRAVHYSAGFSQKEIIKIVSVESRNGGDGTGDKINEYFYNEKGQLIYINGDRDVDGGELFNDLFFLWEGNCIKKIFNVKGVETLGSIELTLIQFS